MDVNILYMKDRIKVSDWVNLSGNNQNKLANLAGLPRGSINSALNSPGGHFVRINSKGEYFVLPMKFWRAFD